MDFANLRQVMVDSQVRVNDVTSPEVVEDDPIRILAERPYIRHTPEGAVGILAEEWLSKKSYQRRSGRRLIARGLFLIHYYRFS